VRREILEQAGVRHYADFFKLDGDLDPTPTLAPAPVYDDPHATRILKPLADEDAVRCTTGLVTPYEGRMVAIQAGECFPKNHPLVKQFPDRFEQIN
jgi:hypothetical protein